MRHTKFGEGIVVSCVATDTDYEVTVAFKGNSGVKRLLHSFAGLEKMDGQKEAQPLDGLDEGHLEDER